MSDVNLPIYPEVMLLEGDAILRKAVTYGNICRALVEIDETTSFMADGENFLNAAREFAAHLKAMRQFAAGHDDFQHGMREAKLAIKKELAAAVAKNDAAGKV